MLSFSLKEFLMVLENYNLSIWPLQIVAYLFGITVLFCSIKRIKHSNKIILAILSFYWFWNGIVFCLIFWAPTYKFAYLFGAFFIIQGFLFLSGIFKANISINIHSNLHSIIGILFLVYAMAGYQLFGYFLGHVYPKFFSFGLVPCPTVIFTFGLFLITDKKFPKYYLIIPFIVAMGGCLATYRGILEDIGLIIAGLLGTIMIVQRDRNFKNENNHST
jgi:hypothetical protein